MSEHLGEEVIAGLAMLDPSDPERRAVEPHVSKCKLCRDALLAARQLFERAFEMVADPPPLSHDGLERTRLAVHRLMPETPRARVDAVGALIALGVLGFVLPLVLLHRRADIPWLIALSGLVLASLATSYALVHRASLGRGIAVLAIVGLSTGLAILEANGGGHVPMLKCLSFELLIAMGPGVATVLLGRRGLLPLDSFSLAAAAAFGAIAGQMALLATCGDHHIDHVLGAHAGGVLMAALLGIVLARVLPRTLRERASKPS